MTRLRRALAIVSSAAFNAAIAAEPISYEYIGDIPAICPITIKQASSRLPRGFRISPEEAVKLASESKIASEKLPVKCNHIFLQQVYADSENYYIIKPLFGPMSQDVDAIVVNGISGKVSARGPK